MNACIFTQLYLENFKKNPYFYLLPSTWYKSQRQYHNLIHIISVFVFMHGTFSNYRENSNYRKYKLSVDVVYCFSCQYNFEYYLPLLWLWQNVESLNCIFFF